MLNPDPKKVLNRAIFLFFGITLIGFGLAMLMNGGLFLSHNSWGGMVFSPVAIAFGLVFVVGAIVKPEIFKP